MRSDRRPRANDEADVTPDDIEAARLAWEEDAPAGFEELLDAETQEEDVDDDDDAA
jgi:hypothetical protein